MQASGLTITGIGSVSPYGTLSGAIDALPLQPRQIVRWPTAGVRTAFLVEPFRPADVVPGLKTRRLDRLSIWALVASSMAIKDAGLDLGQLDPSRTAIVCATALGCIELTEAFLQSAVDNTWSQTDPIVFPETLGNAPASHVARCLELSGPNITVSSSGQAGECALLHAASLVRHGQADRAIVIAGDTLTRTAYEWCEVAGLLSPVESGGGFIPSEGVTAMVLESESARAMRPYARLRSVRLAAGTDPAAIGKELAKLAENRAVRYSVFDRSTAAVIVEAPGDAATIVVEGQVGRGLRDTGALFRLAASLHATPAGSLLVLTGIPSERGFATLLVEAL
jgi:3-oxoacyl-(acyl-carrier-protein) synthase